MGGYSIGGCLIGGYAVGDCSIKGCSVGGVMGFAELSSPQESDDLGSRRNLQFRN